MKEETRTLNEEADKLGKINDLLTKQTSISLYPTINSYVKIEKNIETSEHELKKWQIKTRLAVVSAEYRALPFFSCSLEVVVGQLYHS